MMKLGIGACVLVMSTLAMAQPSPTPGVAPGTTPGTTPGSTTGAPSAPAKPTSPPPPPGTSIVPQKSVMPKAPERPALTRYTVNKRNWTLTAEIRLHAYQTRVEHPRDIQPTGRFAVDQARFLFPVPSSSSTHDCDTERIEGFVRAENVVLSDKLRLVEGYQAGERLAVLESGPFDTQRFTMQVKVPMTSYETRIDEALARQYDWPKQGWPDILKSALEPQLFIEVSDPLIQDLVKSWTQGNPRAMRPYDLAKLLAGKVLEYYQPSEGIYEAIGRGPLRRTITGSFIAGYNVRGAAAAAEQKRGSSLDLANLLVSTYRVAGLPARIVIGYDVEEAEIKKRGLAIIRPWVEFYLYDEKAQTGEWIPVDIIKQREFSNRMPPLTQRWEHFGYSEDFDFMCPVSFHWHPPTAAISADRSPAFWGWIPEPRAPIVDQELRLNAMETPTRGDDPRLRNRQRRP